MLKLEAKKAAVLGGLLIATLAIIFWITGESAAPQGQKNTEAAPVGAGNGAEVRTLRLGLNIAAGSALHAAAVKFSEQVAEQSKGKLKVTVYPNQELGSDDQMLEMARNGTLDLVLIPTAKLSSAIPAMQYADLPFYFSNREELYAMLDGEPGQLLLSKLGRVDLVGLTFWENGFKQFTANTLIRNPKDFAKLRIRTMKSPLINDQFASLGAQPIPIDFHATYQALKDGAVDGQENPLVAIVGMRFHDVQKHLTISNHAYLGYVFSASKKVFETLSPEMREIIQKAARELTLWEREETARRETDFIAQIRSAGVEVYTLTPEERQQFAQVMAPIADKFGFVVGYDLLAKTEELRLLRDRKVAAKAKEPWLVALDADLSARGAQAGGAIYRGIQMALEEINQKGGVLGAPLHLLARDHGAISGIGRRNLNYFAEIPQVVAVVGGMHTAVISDELEDIHRLKMPYLIPWAAGQGLIKHDYQPSFTFRVSINDGHVAPFLLDRALKQNGSVAILIENTTWGRSNEAALKPVLEKLPAGAAEIAWFNQGDTGVELVIERFVKSGKRAVVLVATGIDAGNVVQAMAKQETQIPIFSHWALVGGDFWGQNQLALKKVDLRFVQTILENDPGHHPKLANFLEQYRKRYGIDAKEPIPSLIGTVHAYDFTHLLARAITQAKSTDRVAIRDALEALRPYQGLLREYKPAFSKEDHDALEPSLLHLGRFDDRGRIVNAE
jgi:tripartite ATP-independent transporter DctP family solute receptor